MAHLPKGYGRPEGAGASTTLVPAAPPEPSGRAPGPRTAIFSGLSWNTAAQLALVLINLGLTPFLLERLGVDRYGLFALLASFRGLLSNLDGGLGPTATRYFAVYAGADDRRATASLLLTMSLLVTAVVGSVAAVVAIFAPDIALLMHGAPGLHESATMLLRDFMPLLLVAALRNVLQRVMSAGHRWAYLNVSQIAGTAIYAVLAVVLVAEGYGLIGLLWACVGQEAVLVITSLFDSRRFVGLRDFRLLPWKETRRLIHYASRVQVAAIASSFNIEIDALIVGAIFPLRYVAFYSIGSNFATQLLGVPMNAVAPIGVTLSRTYGRAGLSGTLGQFAGIQRTWVRTVAALPLVGAASAYFGIYRWLGSGERLAGLVAVILLVGRGASLWSQVMDALGKSVERPGLESRYLGLGMVINLVITVPLALTIGMLGVPLGTAIAELVSRLYFVRIARRDLGADLRSFLAEVPKLAVLAAVGVTALLELPAFRFAPHGPAGLIICAVPAVVGLAVYAVLVLNSGRSILATVRHLVRGGAHRRRGWRRLVRVRPTGPKGTARARARPPVVGPADPVPSLNPVPILGPVPTLDPVPSLGPLPSSSSAGAHLRAPSAEPSFVGTFWEPRPEPIRVGPDDLESHTSSHGRTKQTP